MSYDEVVVINQAESKQKFEIKDESLLKKLMFCLVQFLISVILYLKTINYFI